MRREKELDQGRGWETQASHKRNEAEMLEWGGAEVGPQKMEMALEMSKGNNHE